VADSVGPVVGASVTYTGVVDQQNTYTVTTDVNGYYYFGPMLAEDYTVTVTGANDDSQTSTVTVPAGSATWNFTLTATTPSPSPT